MNKIQPLKIKVKPRRRTRDELEDLIWLLRPLTYLEYAFGVFRYYARKGQLRVVPTALRIYGFILSAAVVGLLATSIRDVSETDIVSKSNVYVAIFFGKIIISTHQIILYTFGVYGRRDGEIIKKISQIDKIFKQPFLHHTPRRLFILLFSVVAVTVALFVWMCFNIKISLTSVVLYKILTYIFIFKGALGKLSFIVYVILVERRMRFICDVLDIINSNKHCFGHIRRYSKDKKMFQKLHLTSKHKNVVINLARAYEKAASSVSIINKEFNFDLIAAFIITFINNIYLIRNLLIDTEYIQGSLVFAISTIYYIFIDNLSNIIMCYCSYILVYYRDRIKTVLSRITVKDGVQSSIKSQSKVFLDITQLCRVELSGFHMFKVDMKSILHFIAVSTTYTILMIQTTREHGCLSVFMYKKGRGSP